MYVYEPVLVDCLHDTLIFVTYLPFLHWSKASCHKITLVGVCKVQNGEAAVVKHLGSDWFNRDIGESE